MAERTPQFIPGSGTKLDKGAKLLMLLIACVSSFALIILAWWKSNKDNKAEQERVRKVAQAKVLLDRQNAINSLAEMSANKERGIVVFKHGTCVAVPPDVGNYKELATAALKLLPQADLKVKIVEQSNGNWLCEFGGPVHTYAFAAEIKSSGAEEMAATLKKNVLLDRSEPDVLKIHPAK